MPETLPKDNAPLTPREQEVFDMLLGGSTPKEIAYSLNVAYDTVIAHQKSMYRKLDVHNINEFLVKFRPAGGDNTALPARNNLSTEEDDCVFDHWYGLGYADTETFVTRKYEMIAGCNVKCVTITGTSSKDNYIVSGVYGRPNVPTLSAMRSMKAISFKAAGDGGDYCIKLPTLETLDGDNWLFVFPTVKDKVITVTVNVPESLVREGWNGKQAEFIQENIISLIFQPAYYGPFNLKFWDIKLHNKAFPVAVESLTPQNANNRPWPMDFLNN